MTLLRRTLCRAKRTSAVSVRRKRLERSQKVEVENQKIQIIFRHSTGRMPTYSSARPSARTSLRCFLQNTTSLSLITLCSSPSRKLYTFRRSISATTRTILRHGSNTHTSRRPSNERRRKSPLEKSSNNPISSLFSSTLQAISNLLVHPATLDIIQTPEEKLTEC